MTSSPRAGTAADHATDELGRIRGRRRDLRRQHLAQQRERVVTTLGRDQRVEQRAVVPAVRERPGARSRSSSALASSSRFARTSRSTRSRAVRRSMGTPLRRSPRTARWRCPAPRLAGGRDDVGGLLRRHRDTRGSASSRSHRWLPRALGARLTSISPSRFSPEGMRPSSASPSAAAHAPSRPCRRSAPGARRCGGSWSARATLHASSSRAPRPPRRRRPWRARAAARCGRRRGARRRPRSRSSRPSPGRCARPGRSWRPARSPTGARAPADLQHQVDDGPGVLDRPPVEAVTQQRLVVGIRRRLAALRHLTHDRPGRREPLGGEVDAQDLRARARGRGRRPPRGAGRASPALRRCDRPGPWRWRCPSSSPRRPRHRRGASSPAPGGHRRGRGRRGEPSAAAGSAVPRRARRAAASRRRPADHAQVAGEATHRVEVLVGRFGHGTPPRARGDAGSSESRARADPRAPVRAAHHPRALWPVGPRPEVRT
jgi:hypothetical protein